MGKDVKITKELLFPYISRSSQPPYVIPEWKGSLVLILFVFHIQMARSTADRRIHDECDNNFVEHPDRSTFADLRAGPGGVTEFIHCAENAGRGDY